jgi:hypothetical protein
MNPKRRAARTDDFRSDNNTAIEGSPVHGNVFWALSAQKRRGRKTPLGISRHRPDEMRADVSEPVEKILTPLDVEVEFRIPRASQKKGRAEGSFAPFFRVGRRVYYRRSVFLAWIGDQEQKVLGHRG